MPVSNSCKRVLNGDSCICLEKKRSFHRSDFWRVHHGIVSESWSTERPYIQVHARNHASEANKVLTLRAFLISRTFVTVGDARKARILSKGF